MLRKPEGYDRAEAVKVGEFQAIPPGWYTAAIMGIVEGSTPSGSPYIEFCIDITDGEFVRYYEKDYRSQRPLSGEKKWRGVVRYFTTEKALPMLKGGITSIEESNPGYVFDWNEVSAKGKMVGVGIRREQYEAADGTLKFATRPFAFCDIKKVIAKEMSEPKDRLIDPSRPGHGGGQGLGYTPPNPMPPGYAAGGTFDPYNPPSAPNFEELGPEEELPF